MTATTRLHRHHGDTPQAKAFNRGCDARLRGWPPEADPYMGGTELSRLWLEGYLDVCQNWGRLAKGPYRKLPEVRKSGESTSPLPLSARPSSGLRSESESESDR